MHRPIDGIVRELILDRARRCRGRSRGETTVL